MTSNLTSLRIVSLQPSATVILNSIGKLDCVVACTKYCQEVCPGLGERVIVADSWTAQSKEILDVKPDLLIASVPYQEKAVVEILKSGTRFLGLAPRTLNDIYVDIAVIAGIAGAAERGAKVISSMKSAIESLRGRVLDSPRPRVFCEEWGKPLIASQPWVAELVEAAGGKFVGNAGAQTSPEAVLAEDPDVVIAAWCGAGNRVPLEKIVARRGWAKAGFVTEGRVYCISDELLNTPAPTLIDGLHALAAAIHPEIFPRSKGLRSINREATHSP